MTIDCVVYRCGKQDQMYLYLRAGVNPGDLPETLLRRVGKLTQAMQLTLAPGRRLARVDVDKVLEKLREPGYYLQMPPQGQVKGHLYFGD